MIMMHKQPNMQMGYSVSVFEKHPNRKELYQLLQPLVYLVKTDKLSATGIAGMNGFMQLSKNKETVSFTPSFGPIAEIPTTEKFLPILEQRVQNLEQNPVNFAQILADAADSAQSVMTVVNARKAELKLAYLYAAMTNEADSVFLATHNAAYFRKFGKSRDGKEEDNIVQSSCEANLTNTLDSDFRLVKVERTLKSKTKVGMDAQSLLDNLRAFPFRTEYTVALNAMEVANLQKCQSIFDGAEVVNCADPPPPENAVSISLSVILMVAVVTAWVFGCLFAKKFDKGEIVSK